VGNSPTHPSTDNTTELLELCEQFFRQAGPIVHAELRQFLTGHGHYGGLGWFLDALGFSAFNRTAQPSITTSATHRRERREVTGRASDQR
jgi:hypothetical protein